MTTSTGADPGIRFAVDDRIARITLDRPDRLNAFAGEMRETLAAAIEDASSHPDVRVIVIEGAGRGFSAGADVDAMATLLRDADEAAFRRNVDAGARVVRAIAGSPRPVIAAVNGVAVGAGASLALACDLSIAADSARIGFTFNRIGLHPDWGATFFLPARVGSGRAAHLLHTARILDARAAEEMGILQEVVPAGEFPDRVGELARSMAERAPLALTAVKASLLSAAGGMPALEAALEREADAQMRCFRSADVREGLAAFREKRRPEFTGA
jgi:2-(1,2-epoxy-1,2-dihydrophenyl)acetyl-CoA isomerase